MSQPSWISIDGSEPRPMPSTGMFPSKQSQAINCNEAQLKAKKDIKLGKIQPPPGKSFDLSKMSCMKKSNGQLIDLYTSYSGGKSRRSRKSRSSRRRKASRKTRRRQRK
jgi:hypothetical protein